eukprot:COSAG01_NODE_59130_length_302_cov_0.645320_2_plen_28_part_01
MRDRDSCVPEPTTGHFSATPNSDDAEGC